MNPSSNDNGNSVVTEFIFAWTAAVAAGDPLVLADLFDEAVLFVATAPAALQGREQVRAYYAKAPPGLRAQATLLQATRPLRDLVHGVADVAFDAPRGVELRGRLGLSLVRRDVGWRVTQYHLSVTRAEST